MPEVPPPLPAGEPAVRPRRASAWLALTLLAVVVGYRLLAICHLGLFIDEGYYWEWSRHLAPSYYDHPPAVAYLIAASTRVLGRTPFAVHFPALLLSALTSLALFRLGLALFPRRRDVAWWAVVAVNLSPLFSFGAVFTTPDAPLTLCWIVAMWLVWRATHGAPRAWYLAGAVAGLGMLSKYSFVLLPVAVALYLARRPQRAWWKRQEPYLAAAIAAAMTAPVLWWNARHGWASFEFQAVTRHLRAWPPWATVPRYFLAQQAISPPLWIACAAAFLHSGSLARRGDDAHAYLWYVSATVLGFFCLASLHAWVNPNWCGIGFLPLVLAAGDLLSTRSRALRRLRSPWPPRSRSRFISRRRRWCSRCRRGWTSRQTCTAGTRWADACER